MGHSKNAQHNVYGWQLVIDSNPITAAACANEM